MMDQIGRDKVLLGAHLLNEVSGVYLTSKLLSEGTLEQFGFIGGTRYNEFLLGGTLWFVTPAMYDSLTHRQVIEVPMYVSGTHRQVIEVLMYVHVSPTHRQVIEDPMYASSTHRQVIEVPLYVSLTYRQVIEVLVYISPTHRQVTEVKCVTQ